VNVVDQAVRRSYRFKGDRPGQTDGEVFERSVQFYDGRGAVRARRRIQGIVTITVERAMAGT
jgi:hypothetical protein